MRTPTITSRVRRVAAWRPGARPGARIVKMLCPHCHHWRSPRYFHRYGGGCRKCIGNG
ncbi:hypothetical protein [Phytohabitans rumicis]|uniref:Uncharacterized protein n=1 Tax=Phytohabitans rumicis TaxID=1076125 RepID=A0A6V8L5F2_9ACTN|nr:hypothetical protein [Phytohabitans rumicis]GFJ87875.1 hypothetical protein Prum_015170 [Phytohabitans rumicis]